MNNIKITEAKARIHAHVCGDGSIYTTIKKRSPSSLRTSWGKNKHYKSYVVDYCNTSKELLNSFKNDILLCYGKIYIEKAKNYRRVRIKKIYEELIKLGCGNSRNWSIKELIMNGNRKIKIVWLQAFFDDEATVDIKSKYIKVKSMNLNGLKQICKLLKDIGILSSMSGKMQSDGSYVLGIYRKKEILKYFKIINFKHPEKLKKSNILIGELK